MRTVSQLVQQSIEQLQTVSDSPRLDAELLLCDVLNKDRSFIHAWPEHELNETQYLAFQEFLARRIKGEPVAHILGERGFWSLNLKVTPDTLIPRPDTERLVELALELIPINSTLNILDLGTGTGAIALSLAKERPTCHITATDQSSKALNVAKHNAEMNKLTNVEFIQSNWFAELDKKQFDLIVSNPPYICDNDSHLKEGDVRFEPLSALTSGSDGLDDIRKIISDSQHYLKKNGSILIEHGYDQAEQVCDLLKAAGFSQIEDFKDYNDQPRVAVAHLK